MKGAKLFIVDYGSQYTFLLARRLRSAAGGGVFCEIISQDQLDTVNSLVVVLKLLAACLQMSCASSVILTFQCLAFVTVSVACHVQG